MEINGHLHLSRGLPEHEANDWRRVIVGRAPRRAKDAATRTTGMIAPNLTLRVASPPMLSMASSARFGDHELVPNITFGSGRANHEVPYDVMVTNKILPGIGDGSEGYGLGGRCNMDKTRGRPGQFFQDKAAAAFSGVDPKRSQR